MLYYLSVFGCVWGMKFLAKSRFLVLVLIKLWRGVSLFRLMHCGEKCTKNVGCGKLGNELCSLFKGKSWIFFLFSFFGGMAVFKLEGKCLREVECFNYYHQCYELLPKNIKQFGAPTSKIFSSALICVICFYFRKKAPIFVDPQTIFGF